ncbi:MAG: caspase family protein [Beijerinckiaceae bacterium]|nr:caspase family protein [Beijerinckiaceae bacterium]
MTTISKLLIGCFFLSAYALTSPVRAEGEKRIAFVVGNAAYQAGPLLTTSNDAGLIAQTLQAAGFDVAGARDLDGEGLRTAFRDFLDKAQASGPDTVAFVYLAGYGLQLDGENYFVPVDAKIAAASDVAVEALRISDYTRRLAGLPLKASFIVLDAARTSPFAKSGPPLAGGLALADADPNMLVAFNAAPGTVAPGESGSYGAYAQALAEMVREGGLSPSAVFDAVRLRVNEATKGAEVPWDVSRITSSFVFFERAKDAPPPAFSAERASEMSSKPIGGLGVQDAYAAAVERDTLEGYEEFLAAYPDDPLASRVRGLLAARRESMTWQRTCRVNTREAYWSYLNRYPRGPHVGDARRRLAAFAAPEEPPPSFAPIAYDVPPPPPPEIVYVDRPVLVFDDPAFGFVPPPPVIFLAPPPVYLVFAPPPPPVAVFVLPVPVFVPVPVWVAPPRYVAPPPWNPVYANIHNTTVINNFNNTNIIRRGPPAPFGGQRVPGAGGAGMGAAGAAMSVALPPSVARRAGAIGGAPARFPGGASPHPAPAALPGKTGALPPDGVPAGRALPGASGRPMQGSIRKPLGGPAQGNLPAAHALPGGQKLPPVPGRQALPHSPKGTEPDGRPGQITRPGALPLAGQQQGKPSAHALPRGRQLPQPIGGQAAIGGAKGGVPDGTGKPASITPHVPRSPVGQRPSDKSGASPSLGSKLQQFQHGMPQIQQRQQPSQAHQQPRAPQHFQQQGRQPPQTYQQPRPPQHYQQQGRQPPQTYQQPRPPQHFQQQWRQPQQTQQQPRAPQHYQQQWHPPQQTYQQPRPPQHFQQQGRQPQQTHQEPRAPQQSQQWRQPQQLGGN